MKEMVNASGGTHIVLPPPIFYILRPSRPLFEALLLPSAHRHGGHDDLPWLLPLLPPLGGLHAGGHHGREDEAGSPPPSPGGLRALSVSTRCEDEIQYLINECEKYLSPSLRVRRRLLAAIYIYLLSTRVLRRCDECLVRHPALVWRPQRQGPELGLTGPRGRMAMPRELTSSGEVSHHPSNGITFVSGGKWTTWREMAEDGVEQVIERHPELKKKARCRP